MRNALDRIALEAPDIRVANLQPHQWWSRIGREALPKIAKQVLALTCSASSCECNWSMYSFVHNKSRNCLGTKKAEDLVYIYMNTRLLRGRLGQIRFDGMRTMCSRRMRMTVWMTTQTRMMEMMMII